MTNQELNKIMMKADMDLENLKDRCHDLYEEKERYKQAIRRAVETLKNLNIDDATACRIVLSILEESNEQN